jgi:hypothetical protein
MAKKKQAPNTLPAATLVPLSALPTGLPAHTVPTYKLASSGELRYRGLNLDLACDPTAGPVFVPLTALVQHVHTYITAHVNADDPRAVASAALVAAVCPVAEPTVVEPVTEPTELEGIAGELTEPTTPTSDAE